MARVRSLLKHLGAAADVDEALTHAASGGHVRVVAALCDAGAHADGAALLKAVTHTLKALPADAPAALARSVAVATELLRRGAPTAGSCALRFACQAGAHELVALLLEHGADVNEAGEHDGVTALMVAAEHAVPATITLLLAAGANPHASSDDCGWSPLHYACADTTQAGNLDVVRALLEGGADSNAASFTGSTPLWIASQVGSGALGGGVAHGGEGVKRSGEKRSAPRADSSYCTNSFALPHRMAALTACSCSVRAALTPVQARATGWRVFRALTLRSSTATAGLRRCCAASARGD